MAIKLATKLDERGTLLARYRAMAEEASDIIVLHEGGRIVFSTGALDRLLKRTPEEFQDGNYLDLVHPDDMDEALMVRGTPPPGEIWAATYRVRHADGHYLWFEIRTRGVYDENTSEFLREVSVGRDVMGMTGGRQRTSRRGDGARFSYQANSAFTRNTRGFMYADGVIQPFTFAMNVGL